VTSERVPQLRIAMTLPSAASLGSYQAGAVAALLVALQCLNTRADVAGRVQPVVVDAVGGASAGAVVGLLATRCLVAGMDPVHVLHRAWVEEASWRRLRRGAHDAPLSLRLVERSARQLLDPRDRQHRPAHRAPRAARQRDAVVLHVDVGCLQGLTFRIRGRGPVVEALTHVDSSEFVFRPGDGPECWSSPTGRSALDVALAAISHPAVFAPRLLDRSDEIDRYRQCGITNPPRSGRQWYADGGALARNPLAGTLHAARRAAPAHAGDGGQDATRVHLLVHPHTAAPDDDGRWTDPHRRPRWTSTLSRVVASLDPESLYADQRRIEHVNTRLHWAGELTDTLAPFLPHEAKPALTNLLARMRAGTGTHPADVPSDGDLRSLVAAAVRAACGVSGKEPVATEVISPLRLLDGAGGRSRAGSGPQAAVPDVLAGEFLGRFGGLLDRRVRHSDFVSGWSSARAWLAEALPRQGLPQPEVDAALASVDGRGVRYGRSGPRGRTDLPDLPLRQRARLAGTVLHAARVAVRDIRRS
jgi:hypothetical protein